MCPGPRVPINIPLRCARTTCGSLSIPIRPQIGRQFAGPTTNCPGKMPVLGLGYRPGKMGHIPELSIQLRLRSPVFLQPFLQRASFQKHAQKFGSAPPASKSPMPRSLNASIGVLKIESSKRKFVRNITPSKSRPCRRSGCRCSRSRRFMRITALVYLSRHCRANPLQWLPGDDVR